MSKYDIHVCMVSGQPAPNLLPLLDPALKPKIVILLATRQMAARAEYLRKVIQPLGIKVKIASLAAADNYETVQDFLLTLLGSSPDGSVALNVTGGTKLMAIAAQEVFRSDKRPVFYVNLQDDTVIFIGETQARHQLQQRIDLKQFLEANGYTIASDIRPVGMPDHYKDLMLSLITQVEQWGNALGQLNYLASRAADNNTLMIHPNDIGGKQDQQLPAMLQTFQRAQLLHERPGGSWQFSSEASRAFANGGWLESYVNSRLNELKSDGWLQDSPRLNLKINTPNQVANELDIAFMAHNHLHIVECKTKRFTGPNDPQAGAEALYKLDSLKELGGLGTKSLLISYRKLRAADKQRADDLRIKVVEASQLKNLKSALKEWIQPSQR